MTAGHVATWVAGVIAALGLAAMPAQAQSVSPANLTVGTARVIVPDGSSLKQAVGGVGETRWFVFGVEPGKTYAVEVVDTDDDTVVNDIGTLNVFAADGTTTPPVETNVDCTMNTRAPSLEVAADGKRCIVRTFPPSPGNMQNKRGLYAAVGGVTGSSFQIRVRESTIYSRWTTNGYDFHVELQNTTADSICVQVALYPGSGDAYGVSWSGGLFTSLPLTIPPFGAVKTVVNNGTVVGTGGPPDSLRGTMRVGACTNPVNFVPGAVHVSTFAYNPLTDKFLYFFVNTANNGATSNSW